MQLDQIRKVTVIGAGLMGSGIAQILAQAGFAVVLNDVKDEFIQKGLSMIGQSLRKFEEKGKLSKAETERIRSKILPELDLAKSVRDSQFVIEAVTENMDVKKSVFKTIDDSTGSDMILATNTSTLSITEIASVTKKPGQVIGMHFFNPPVLMKLIEIIRGLLTSDEILETTKAISIRLGKTPIVTRDSPGFVANRIFLPMINEAILVLQEGLCSKEEIDTTMKLGFNHPMGPLELADYIGLDTTLFAIEAMHKELNDPKYRPALLLKQMIKAGRYGRKNGKGFYDYTTKTA